MTCVVQIKGKVRDRIEVPADISEDALREQVLALPKVVAATEARRPHRHRAGAEARQRRPGLSPGAPLGSGGAASAHGERRDRH